MDPCVGFFTAAPPRFAPPDGGVAVVGVATQDWRPGSGITDDRREPALPESEAGELELAPSAVFVDNNAASKTSFKKGFFVEAKRAICSSGTVSLFFSRKPSAS